MKIIAHRSGPVKYPEQTIASAKLALDSGADMAEIDLRRTADGTIVVCHDENALRHFGVDKNVGEMTDREFLSLRHVDDRAFGAHRFEDYLACSVFPLLLHIKETIISQDFFDLIDRYDCADKLYFGVSDTDSVRKIREYYPNAKILAFMPRSYEIEAFAECGADFLRLWEKDITDELVARIKSCGKSLWIMTDTDGVGYTPDDRLEKLLALLPDGILVNDVSTLCRMMSAFSPSALISDHAVFAKDKPIRIFGDGYGIIKVTFDGKTKTVTSQNGKWLAEFLPQKAGGPYTLTVECGEKSLSYSDIYVGQVVLYSGQSNMEYQLKATNTPTEHYVSSDKLRLFAVDKIANHEFYSAKDGWVSADSSHVGEWTALGYLSGLELEKHCDDVIGVVSCSLGSSPIESWLPEGTLDRLGLRFDGVCHTPTPALFDRNREGALFSRQLSPLFPLSLTAVVWYQGEADTSEEEAPFYLGELCALVDIWRESFCDRDLPFVIVQIADLIERNDSGWRQVQRAQTDICGLRKGVVSVNSSEVCENNDLHPRSKYALGLRIAQALMSL